MKEQLNAPLWTTNFIVQYYIAGKKKVDTSKWIFRSAKRLTYLICFFLNNLVLILYDMNVSIWHYRRSN